MRFTRTKGKIGIQRWHRMEVSARELLEDEQNQVCHKNLLVFFMCCELYVWMMPPFRQRLLVDDDAIHTILVVSLTYTYINIIRKSAFR